MKKDLRIIKTQNNLRQALTNLLKNNSFEEIKVSDICSEALINRSTFYAHYNDKYELLLDMINELKKDILLKVDYDKNSNNIREYYLALIKSLLDFMENSQNIYKPIIINNRNSIIMDILLDVISKDVENNLNDYKNTLDVPVDILTKFYIGALVSICVSFLENPNRYTKKELINYLSKLIPSI